MKSLRSHTVPALAAALLVALSLACGAAQARSLEGQAFEETVKLQAAGPMLQLNGLGLRGVAWIKAYVAGLYVTAPSHDGGRLLADAGPKRLRLKVMLAVPADAFAKSLRDGVNKRETPQSLARLQAGMQVLDRSIIAAGDLKEGDVIDLDYDPARGVSFTLNGHLRAGHVDGAELYRAILNIFIGDRPIDRQLKQGLLGA